MKLAIIGTGLYSTAFASILEQNRDNDVYLWTENEVLAKKFKKTQKFDFFPKMKKMGSNVVVSTSYEDVLKDASLIFIMTSSKYYLETIKAIKPFYKKDTPIFVGTKGMDFEKYNFFSNYTRKFLKCNSYTFFAGPTFAKEMLPNDYLFFTFAGSNKKGYYYLDRVFSKYVITEFIEDLNGLELMSVLKNIFAIFTGILNGLKVSNGVYNASYANMLKEVSYILDKFYGSQTTIFTYGGIGDFLLTTNSKTSRNFTYGKMIGSKEKEEEIKKFQENNTIEGLESLDKFYFMAEKKHLKLKMIPLLYQIIFEKKDPKSIYELFS